MSKYIKKGCHLRAAILRCSYGCGQPGVVKFKNGRWSCHKIVSKCPAIVKKRSETFRETASRKAAIMKEIKLMRSRSKIQCPHCAGFIGIQLLKT